MGTMLGERDVIGYNVIFISEFVKGCSWINAEAYRYIKRCVEEWCFIIREKRGEGMMRGARDKRYEKVLDSGTWRCFRGLRYVFLYLSTEIWFGRLD